MGLHLNWELRLPWASTPDDVARHLDQLQHFALGLPFDYVSPRVNGHVPEWATVGRPERAIQFFSSIVAEPWDEDTPPRRGDPTTAQGFIVDPGDGCETAHFGLLRRADEHGQHGEWFWHCSCKTQYASTRSDEHLVKCHTSLVRLLDHAIELGIDVVVRDETHYWDTRDQSRLIAEVHHMNRIVATFAGQMSDALGSDHSVQAEIFNHPRFERLEMGE
jgi:hypothetical protein